MSFVASIALNHIPTNVAQAFASAYPAGEAFSDSTTTGKNRGRAVGGDFPKLLRRFDGVDCSCLRCNWSSGEVFASMKSQEVRKLMTRVKVTSSVPVASFKALPEIQLPSGGVDHVASRTKASRPLRVSPLHLKTQNKLLKPSIATR